MACVSPVGCIVPFHLVYRNVVLPQRGPRPGKLSYQQGQEDENKNGGDRQESYSEPSLIQSHVSPGTAKLTVLWSVLLSEHLLFRLEFELDVYVILSRG